MQYRARVNNCHYPASSRARCDRGRPRTPHLGPWKSGKDDKQHLPSSSLSQSGLIGFEHVGIIQAIQRHDDQQRIGTERSWSVRTRRKENENKEGLSIRPDSAREKNKKKKKSNAIRERPEVNVREEANVDFL